MKPAQRAILLLISTIGLLPVKAGETIYFLVGHPRPSDWELVWDSYVLPLSKQEDIDHARYLIALADLSFRSPTRPLWVRGLAPGKTV